MSGVVVRLPLTCGELVQGTLAGVPVLVSAPIARWGEARLAPDVGLRVPRWLVKVRQALAGAGAVDVRLSIHRPVRVGAGYGTSTADVAGALAAWELWQQAPLDPEGLARRAVMVEPSDSTMFPGLTLFAHRDASIVEALGPAPVLPLLLLDPGGALDTVAWTRRLPSIALDSSTEAALNDLRYALASGDHAALGAAASRSAAAYQSVLPSEIVAKALRITRAVGALGVIRAHSGPIAGLLFADETTAEAAWPRLIATMPTCAISLTTLVDGGVTVVRALDLQMERP